MIKFFNSKFLVCTFLIPYQKSELHSELDQKLYYHPTVCNDKLNHIVECNKLTTTITSSTLSLSPARIGCALYRMLMVQAFRADRLLAVASQFVVTVFGEKFQQYAEQELDLADIVTTEVRQC